MHHKQGPGNIKMFNVIHVYILIRLRRPWCHWPQENPPQVFLLY